jgi:hypothetical protein
MRKSTNSQSKTKLKRAEVWDQGFLCSKKSTSGERDIQREKKRKKERQTEKVKERERQWDTQRERQIEGGDTKSSRWWSIYQTAKTFKKSKR